MATSSSPLDQLPSELKIKILALSDRVLTLYCLIRASATYHAVYRQNRETILTRVTLKTLKQRDVDILQHQCVAEVVLHGHACACAIRPAVFA